MSSKEFLELIEKENLDLDCKRLRSKTTIQNKTAEDLADDILVKLILMDVLDEDALTIENFVDMNCQIVKILTKK